MSLSPSQPLSTKYKVSDLTRTSAPVDNSIPDEYESNITKLAAVLEQLEDVIGPFRIASAWRSNAAQAYLATQGLPVAKGKSYHTVGLGADIVPTAMTIDDAFGSILANPIKDEFAEISLKETQGAIHLGVKYAPYQATKVTALNDSGEYAALSMDEISRYAAPFLEVLAEGSDLAARNPIKTTLIVSLVLLSIGGLMLLRGQTA